MKKIEKEIILMDYENSVNQYKRKIGLLDNIILYYNEEILSENQEVIEDNVFDEKNKIDDDVLNIEENENSKETDTEETKNTDDANDIDNNVEDVKKKEDLLPQDIKLLYRKIMMITHPDKIKNSLLLKEYDEYYKYAVEAKKNNNELDIIYIAYKLNIKEVYNVDNEYFNKLKYNITKKNTDITRIENSPYWVWYYTDNNSLKNIMKNEIKKHSNR